MRYFLLVVIAFVFIEAQTGCICNKVCNQSASARDMQITKSGDCFKIYAVSNWSRDSIKSAWGDPTRIIKNKKDFTKSNNDFMQQFMDEEIEQWVYVNKPGIGHTLVTFDATGNAVRAINEWSDF